MPGTQHIHRLLVVLPASRVAAFRTFWAAAQSKLPEDDPGAWPGLSATGAAPATHVWSSGAYTDAEGKVLLMRLCQQAAVTQPSQWDVWDREQKKTWLRQQRRPVYDVIGVLVVAAENDGAWSDPLETLAFLGLQPVSSRTT